MAIRSSPLSKTGHAWDWWRKTPSYISTNFLYGHKTTTCVRQINHVISVTTEMYPGYYVTNLKLGSSLVLQARWQCISLVTNQLFRSAIKPANWLLQYVTQRTANISLGDRLIPGWGSDSQSQLAQYFPWSLDKAQRSPGKCGRV